MCPMNKSLAYAVQGLGATEGIGYDKGWGLAEGIGCDNRLYKNGSTFYYFSNKLLKMLMVQVVHGQLKSENNATKN